MCQTVLQQRCSSAVHAVLAALLLHTMLKNAECITATVLHYCCVLRSMNGTWGLHPHAVVIPENPNVPFALHELYKEIFLKP